MDPKSPSTVQAAIEVLDRQIADARSQQKPELAQCLEMAKKTLLQDLHQADDGAPGPDDDADKPVKPVKPDKPDNAAKKKPARPDLTSGGAIKLLAQAYARLVHRLKHVACKDAQAQPVRDNDNKQRPSANAAQLLVKLLHLILTGADATASHHLNFYNTFTVLVPFPALEGCPVEEVPVAFAATRAGEFLTEYFAHCGMYIARMPHLYGNKCSSKDVPDTCVPAAGGKVVYQTELAYAKQDTLLNMPLVFALAFKVLFRYFCRDYEGYARGMASFDNSGMDYLGVFRCGRDAGIKAPDGMTRIMCNLLKKLQKRSNEGAPDHPVHTYADIRYGGRRHLELHACHALWLTVCCCGFGIVVHAGTCSQRRDRSPTCAWPV